MCVIVTISNTDERTSERRNARETNAIRGAASARTAAANLLEIRWEQQRRQKAPPPPPLRRSSPQLAQQPLRCAGAADDDR